MAHIFLAFLLVSSVSCNRIQMVQTSLDTDMENEVGEQAEDESMMGYTICTIVENPRSSVQYGLAIKFPVKNCPVYCNANRIISQTIPDNFIRARPNKQKDATACACYSIIAPGMEEFIFGFTPQEVVAESGCNAKSCWHQYTELSTYVKQREMMKKSNYRLQQQDFLTSANHYSTSKEDGNEFSADCEDQNRSSYEVQMTNLVTMKDALELIGDTSGVKILEGMATAEDPDDLDDAEIEELAERTDAKVVLTSTEAAGTELEKVVKEDVEDVDISDMTEDEMFAALSAQNKETGTGEETVDTTVLVDIIPLKRPEKVSPEKAPAKAVEVAPRLPTRKMVQPIMLAEGQDTCSRGAQTFSTYADAVCGPIESESQCKAVAQSKGDIVDEFTAFTTDMEMKKDTLRMTQAQPSGCFMRRSGEKWHAFWNELGKYERAATGKKSKKGKRSTVFEYRLLCGCYREVMEIDTEFTKVEDKPVAIVPAGEAIEVSAMHTSPENEMQDQAAIVEPPVCEIKCKNGKACGDTCISALKDCTKAPGKACNVEVEELQRMEIVAEEAIERGELHQAMADWHGEGSDIAACGVHADALTRADCICNLANHWSQGDNGKEVGVGPRVMQGECNDLMTDAKYWAQPFSCSIVSKKKGKKSREKSCRGSRTLSWGSTGGSTSGGSASPMKLNFADFFGA